MKTLIIPDLHGKVEIAAKAIQLADEYEVVFLGDYLDDFKRSVEDQVTIVTLVLEAIRSGKNVVGLLGNHEWSYLDPHKMRCSGFTPSTATYVISLKKAMLEYLKPFYKTNGFLCSHAGVSNNLLKDIDQTLDEYLNTGDFKQIGHSRGGTDKVGGLYWCDWYVDFKPIPYVNQVVGHSRHRPGKEKGILGLIGETETSFNTDCLNSKPEFLVINEDETWNIIQEL